MFIFTADERMRGVWSIYKMGQLCLCLIMKKAPIIDRGD
nr:MAG TPA: hypothetical protein [Caudoviricetes sp.]